MQCVSKGELINFMKKPWRQQYYAVTYTYIKVPQNVQKSVRQFLDSYSRACLWYVIEYTKAGDPHIHGILGVEKALSRKDQNKWPHGRSQVRKLFKNVSLKHKSYEGWIYYIYKYSDYTYEIGDRSVSVNAKKKGVPKSGLTRRRAPPTIEIDLAVETMVNLQTTKYEVYDKLAYEEMLKLDEVGDLCEFLCRPQPKVRLKINLK